MIIIPSIDLKNGKCVRLLQGNFDKVSVYEAEPENVAFQFLVQGAETLHVVDLDGAKNGKIKQRAQIKKIRAAFSGILQVGGGVRSDKDIDNLLSLGIDRVVIGSCAISAMQMTKEWLKKYGAEKIVLALDFKMYSEIPYVAVNGWQQQTTENLWTILNQYPEVLHILCTDINQDGMQLGPNLAFYASAKERYPNINMQASGGVSNISDIIGLKKLHVSGAIIGKALHENTLNLQEAILCSR